MKIALRTLLKNKGYSFINIAGLAIAAAVSLVIILFVLDELRYDRYNEKADRIFRLDNEIKVGSDIVKMATSAAPAGHTLQMEYPEIESTVRFLSWGTYLVRNGDAEGIKEENVIWTDSTFFKIFSVNILEGNARSPLSGPGNAAISRKIAEKYFPGVSPIGKSLLMDNKYNITITAVYENIPSTSHFHFDFLIALMGRWPATNLAQSTAFLNQPYFNTYLLLKNGANAAALEVKLGSFARKYENPASADQGFTKYSLTPLTDIHLHSSIKGELEPNGSIIYVYLFSTIAAFILVIACINFMNLATARAGSRAKEVGVRKVLGTKRSGLILQFLTESIMITAIAFFFAVGLAWSGLPFFNQLSLKNLHIPFDAPLFYLLLLTMLIIVGVMAGIYPAFVLSGMKPVNVVKGKAAPAGKGNLIRGGLVVVQFVISILLIVGAITVYEQVEFIQTKKLGFDKDQLIVIKDAYALRPNIQSFQNAAENISGVENCTISGFIPVEGGPDISRSDMTFYSTGNQPTGENLVSLQHWVVDGNYISTFKMKVVKGRDFSVQFPSDSNAVVLNESAVEQLRLGDNPIGKTIRTPWADDKNDFDNSIPHTVIGVIEDFHYSSLHSEISPLGLFPGRSDGFICVRVNGSNHRDIVRSLEKIWHQTAANQPFQYSFLDSEYDKMYASEVRLGKIFGAFSIVAIVIACLGLFALTAFSADQRFKEIGIRKVLGASAGSIVLLLSKEFGKLILISFCIALPIAWYGVAWWLKSFTYKTEIGPSVYLLAGVVTLLVAGITTSFQSFKAAISNPVDAMK